MDYLTSVTKWLFFPFQQWGIHLFYNGFEGFYM